jgi:hypothetical protein
MNLRLFFALPLLALSTDILCNEVVKPYGHIVLRYEDEKNHTNIKPRERMRLIARLALKGKLSSNWQYDVSLGTGLKDRQNVPAITIHKFNDQPSPPSDVFLQKAFVVGSFDKHKIKLGKIPWQSWQVTDAFWDRDIATLGANYSYSISNNSEVTMSLMSPIDGEKATVGSFALVHWQKTIPLSSDVKLKVAPWLFDYRGESDAQFAKKDTQYNNTFLNFSAQLSYKAWKLGLDASHSLTSRDEDELATFKNERDAISVELSHGSLAQQGSYLIQARYHHIERFGVLTEYAQNATQRFATSNYRGWDLRVRRKMASNWWLGTRLSIIKDIIANRTGLSQSGDGSNNITNSFAEKGTRFRIEARYAF